MDQDDIKEMWLKDHAIDCPVYTGRISLKQCTFFRSLPAEMTGPNIVAGVRARRNFDTRVRDIACESCSTWKAKGLDPEEKQRGTLENVKRKKQ